MSGTCNQLLQYRNLRLLKQFPVLLPWNDALVQELAYPRLLHNLWQGTACGTSCTHTDMPENVESKL